MRQKGVIYVYNYIFNLEINKDSLLVMVVDCISVVIGWWFLWSHFVIAIKKQKHAPNRVRVFILVGVGAPRYTIIKIKKFISNKFLKFF